MYQSYDLSRYFEGDLSHSTSITVSDDDAINCAHMLAAGFNTMSRNMMGDFVLAVVDTKAGTAHYDGKIEKFDRPEPRTLSTSFTFEASTDPDMVVTFFGEDDARLIYPSKLSFTKLDEDTETLAKSAAAHISRDVLEDAYAELQAVKEVLADAGVETIPADAGATDLRAMLRARDAEIAELVQERTNRAAEQAKYESDEYMPLRWESFAKIDDALRDNNVTNSRLDEGVRELGRRLEHEYHARTMMEQQHAQANESARAEMISFVKRAHAKKVKLQIAVPDGDGRPELDDRWRGMLDVLAKFLVMTGEADASEGHAVARRLCGISDE